MGQGQGSITVNQRVVPAPPPGPPFALNSAENGLSVDPVTGRIVLGDPNNITLAGQFLSERFLNMNSFDLQMWDGPLVNYFMIDPGSSCRFGDINGAVGAGVGSLQMDFNVFTSNLLTRSNGGHSALFLDGANNLSRLGDVNAVNNGNLLSIDDILQRWEIGRSSFATHLLLHFPSAGIGLSYFDEAGTNPFLIPTNGSNGNTFLTSPDFVSGLTLEHAASGGKSILGDIGGLGNGITLSINDAGRIVLLGDHLANNNGTYLSMEDVLNRIIFRTGVNAFPASEVLNLDGTNGVYQMGDISGNGNTSRFVIDDTAQTANFFAINGLVINGTPGFTGTVAPPLTITVNGGIVTNVA